MTLNRWFLLLGTVFVALAETSRGQQAVNWRVYKAADSLPESACVSVTIGSHGKVLANHLNSPFISELDGYAISVIPSPGAGSDRVCESPSGQLWTVVPGGLQEFRDGAWVLHPVTEIAAELRAGLPRAVHPIPLCPVRKDLVIFLLPDRLMELNFEVPDHPRTEVLRLARQTPLASFSGMILARDGGLWIAGLRGLAKAPGPARNLRPESEWREYFAPESLQIQNFQEPQEDDDGGVTVVAESSNNRQKMVAHFDGQHWAAWPAGVEKVRYAWRGPDQTTWAMTMDVLFEREAGRTEMIENDEISAREYFDLAVEPGGTFWLTTSDGLFHYAPSLWRTPGSIRKINALVHGLAEDAEGRLWFISGNDLHALQNEMHQEHPMPGTTTGRNLPAAGNLFPLKDGTLLLDAGDQLFQFRPGSGVFNSNTDGERGGGTPAAATSVFGFIAIPPDTDGRRFRPLGLLRDGNLCVHSFNPAASQAEDRLEFYDGTKFQSFPNPPPATVLAGGLAVFFATQNGDLWLSGNQGIAWCHDRKWRMFSPSDKNSPGPALGFAELADGRIWCATRDRIWEFDGRNWSTVRAGFDHINALLRTQDGSVWVACNSGMHRFCRGAWVENGVEEGLPSAEVRQLCEDQRGRVWAGTTRGLALFHPEADPDPPQTHIQKLTDKENNVPEGGTVTLAFSAQDKWKYTPADRLLFSCKLDDRDWSAFQEMSHVSFSDLPAGKHTFWVRAMDRNCNVDPKPARLEFAVVVPWYKETRLVLILCAGLAVALFFAGLAFNRHRRLLRSYAEVERKIAERTRELESANLQLLQSQKMNALGTLAAGIAHDFNNILSIIKGSAQIIEDNLDNQQKVRTRVDRIKTVVEQGAGIIKAMLGFSRGSGEQPGLCDLNAIVDDTIKLLGDRFLREMEVSFEPAPNLPQVPASRDFIQQILLNFIFNAAESKAVRKQVLLATRQLDQLPVGVVLPPAQAAAYVSISVRDFGCGIPPENLPRIFEPFFTTKALSVRRGTGLGLSMAYELARKMEAGLAVESVVDQGSTFTLILPVRDLPPDTRA